MHHFAIGNEKIDLFLTDTGRIYDQKKMRQLSKTLKVTIDSARELLKGQMTKEIKLKPKIELSLTLCGNKKIKSLNNQYRNKDKVTDVLSFPMYKTLRSSHLDAGISFLKVLVLGDIVISKEVAKSQARRFSITYEQELIHLFVHGLLHLLGYDHEKSKKEEELMEGLEGKLVQRIYKKMKIK